MDRSELKRVGILGGTFDPPHLAHLRICEEIKESFLLDLIFFIPAGYPPHKDLKTLTPFEMRYEMTVLATENNPSFKVLDLEREIKPSYTLKTLQILKTLYPETEFYLIIGWDSFVEFETWWHYERFLEYTNLIVASRRGLRWEEVQAYFYNKIRELWTEREALDRVFFHQGVNLDLSSSLIRKLVRRGRSIRYLVPEKVYFYILEKKLYR